MTNQLFPALVEACRPAWDAYVEHEFVRQMQAGTLPREAYLRYLRQDYVFLIHFSRAWALAAVKTDRIAEMRICAGTVNALIGEEIELHIETCAREGITLDALEATVEAPACLAYTRYVTDAGLRGDLLDLLVTLAPCVLGYGVIGPRLAEATKDTADHSYAEWIATYAGADYQGACRAVEGLIDDVTTRTIGDDAPISVRWSDLRRQFETACRLEADFWQHGLTG
ncbi:MAG: TenA family protein [Pseudomonadota bacterium]